MIPIHVHIKLKSLFSKSSNTFLFLFANKMLVIRAEIHKMLIRIANRTDPYQTASSDQGLHCFSMPFWSASSVQNFRTTRNVPYVHLRLDSILELCQTFLIESTLPISLRFPCII